MLVDILVVREREEEKSFALGEKSRTKERVENFLLGSKLFAFSW